MKNFCFAFRMLGAPCKRRIPANEHLRQRCLPLPSHLMIQRQPLLLTRSPLTQNMSKCSVRVQDARSTLKTMYTTQRPPQTRVHHSNLVQSENKNFTALHPLAAPPTTRTLTRRFARSAQLISAAYDSRELPVNCIRIPRPFTCDNYSGIEGKTSTQGG